MQQGWCERKLMKFLKYSEIGTIENALICKTGWTQGLLWFYVLNFIVLK